MHCDLGQVGFKMATSKFVLVVFGYVAALTAAQAIHPVSSPVSNSSSPTVDLGYVKYRGWTNSTAGISYFRGIQYVDQNMAYLPNPKSLTAPRIDTPLHQQPLCAGKSPSPSKSPTASTVIPSTMPLKSVQRAINLFRRVYTLRRPWRITRHPRACRRIA